MAVIAEFAQSHNGDLKVLEEMVKVAAGCGAKFAKIQTFFADDLSDAWKHDHARMKSLELDWDAHEKFVTWCERERIKPMTTVYSSLYLSRLQSLGFQDIKIGSPQAHDKGLILNASFNSHRVYVSTGGHNLSEVPKLPAWVHCYFHCSSQYPTNPYRTNLSRMIEIREKFGTKIGYSSHVDPTGDWKGPLFIASCAADYLEVHFTVLPRDQIKDGPVSLESNQLQALCIFDSMTLDEKIEKFPVAGIFFAPQPQSERDLITKYKGRWNV